MSEQNNIVIPLEEKSYPILVGLVEKYKLMESYEEAIEKVKAHKLFNENIIIRLTRDLMLEKISNHDFLDALHKELGTPEEITKKLGVDIVHELVPTLEKIPEDKLVEYNRKKADAERKLEPEVELESGKEEISEELKKESFKQAKEELLEKINAHRKIEKPKEEPQPLPGVKKPETQSVEANAKNIEHEQQKPAPEKPTAPPEPKKPADPYKESVE